MRLSPTPSCRHSSPALRAALAALLALPVLAAAAAPAAPAPATAVLASEFIYETAPFPSCHASTIAETPAGLVAAWFGGKHEKNPDVAIWVARQEGQAWTAPVEVANGNQPGGRPRLPCWNPVLHQPKDGPLLLFYKVGPSPSTWWGMLITSRDQGRTWSAPQRLPEGILGPIKNKAVPLPDGTLLCPSSTEHDGWRLVMERTRDLGQTWDKTGPLNDGKKFAAIQPTVLLHPGNRLQLLCRTRQNVVAESWSTDGGLTWSPLAATALPNPSSGIDGVTLRDGRHLLVYNPTRQSARDRTPLIVGLSRDGKDWSKALTLEDQPGEYSYPAIIQAADGRVHITYTWKRKKIRHVVVDPARL
ncbi:MAG: hypothetical protein RJA22_2211 [Verrucomicrobiota bacterium]|jgi:predicted neuraminidase